MVCGVVDARLDHDHAALDVRAWCRGEQQTDVLTGRPSSSSLRNISTPVTVVLLRVADADDLDLLFDLDDAALDTTGDDGATTRDREDVLDRHQERLVGVALGVGMYSCRPRSWLEDRLFPLASPLRAGKPPRGRPGCRRPGTRTCRSSSRTSISTSSSILVVDHVALVEERRRSPARRPGGRAARAHGSAASGRRSRRPPGSRRPSARHR